MTCPLCDSTQTSSFCVADDKEYRRCHQCQARFMTPEFWPSKSQELAQYQLHENDIDDPGYRNFLSTLTIPLLTKLAAKSTGLDFGCGPGPALAKMMEEAGHDVNIYDPVFHPDTGCLKQSYDFVTCTETAEHFHHPKREFKLLMSLVKPGGWLAIMTNFQTDDQKFANWHYRRDPTHVVFYREDTFHWLASDHGWTCEVPVKNIALMQKPD